MGEYSLQEKVGQMMFVGVNKENVDNILVKLVRDYKVGGIILYKKNYKNYDEMLKLVNKLKDANKENKIPLFIGIDQEGGRVNRFPSDISRIKSAYSFTKKKDLHLLKEGISVTSELLKKTGINLNFAPVLDIKRYDDNHYIGDRSYGTTSDEVSKYGVFAMKEYINNGIIPVIKHFPGCGLKAADSHYLLPHVDNFSDFKEDIIPFLNAIKEGAEVIMLQHILIKDIDKKHPFYFSKDFISKIRNDYGFKGILMTDDVKMRSIRYLYTKKYLLTNIINSGINLIMFQYKENDEIKIIKKIVDLVSKNEINIENIDKSFELILNLKNKYKINDQCINGINVNEINDNIDKCNEKL